MIGETISHYKILEKLGEGGMGVVYKAQDTTLDRFVAIKVLPPHLSKDEEATKRFIHEAKAASALDHAHIGTIYDVDKTSDGRTFIVMAHYEGETLRERIDRGSITIDEALDITKQVASGLARAHETEIVHRDIKPSNIIITKHGEAKIIDFGLAKLAGKTRLTKEGSTLGTAAYMSPEQAKGLEVDHRSDIFSLGAVFYELLTGEQPFKGEHEAALLYEIVHEEPEPLTALRSQLPKELEYIVYKTFAKNSDKRYQKMNDFIADLESTKQCIESIDTVRRPRKAVIRRRNHVLIACCIVIVIAVAVVMSSLYIFTADGESIDSIAVLPLENLSGDPNEDYFSDGMTEALITELSRISALRVISRTSAMQYKGVHKSLSEIARELDVDAVVEGSVLRVEDEVRITAQLVKAVPERHLWADDYERELRDILVLQKDVARAIANEVKVKLTPQEETNLTNAMPIDRKTYEYYLRGRYHWNKRTKEDLDKSLEYYTLAIEMDPDYALAYAGLADVYAVISTWGFYPPEDMVPKAKEAALKALQLDETLAGPYATMAAIKIDYDWEDWKGAERYFKHSIELNPNYATAHQWYAECLSIMGRHREARKYGDQALELDPLSLITNFSSGWCYYHAHQYNKAIEQFRKTLELNDNFVAANHYISKCYLVQGMYSEAIREYQEAIAKDPRAREYVEVVGQIYEESGIEGFYNWLIGEGLDLSDEPYNKPYFLARCYAALGEKDAAFEWLEKAYEVRSSYMRWLVVDPELDNLRADSRLQALIQKVGLWE